MVEIENNGRIETHKKGEDVVERERANIQTTASDLP